VKTFISYASEDKEWAGKARSILDQLGAKPFLAHKDIAVSQEWLEEIAAELADASVFVAFLSRAFRNSDWCSQELGWIASRANIVKIPLSLDGTMPYGFISHLQAQVIRSESELDAILTSVLLREKPRETISAAIKRAGCAQSFRIAEIRLQPLVQHFSSLTNSEAASLANTAIQNSQIWDAGLCRTEYLPQFLKLNRNRIDPEQLHLLASRIEYLNKES
jgi:hypothetical protein